MTGGDGPRHEIYNSAIPADAMNLTKMRDEQATEMEKENADAKAVAFSDIQRILDELHQQTVRVRTRATVKFCEDALEEASDLYYSFNRKQQRSGGCYDAYGMPLRARTKPKKGGAILKMQEQCKMLKLAKAIRDLVDMMKREEDEINIASATRVLLAAADKVQKSRARISAGAAAAKAKAIATFQRAVDLDDEDRSRGRADDDTAAVAEGSTPINKSSGCLAPMYNPMAKRQALQRRGTGMQSSEAGRAEARSDLRLTPMAPGRDPNAYRSDCEVLPLTEVTRCHNITGVNYGLKKRRANDSNVQAAERSDDVDRSRGPVDTAVAGNEGPRCVGICGNLMVANWCIGCECVVEDFADQLCYAPFDFICIVVSSKLVEEGKTDVSEGSRTKNSVLSFMQDCCMQEQANREHEDGDENEDENEDGDDCRFSPIYRKLVRYVLEEKFIKRLGSSNIFISCHKALSLIHI